MQPATLPLITPLHLQSLPFAALTPSATGPLIWTLLLSPRISALYAYATKVCTYTLRLTIIPINIHPRHPCRKRNTDSHTSYNSWLEARTGVLAALKATASAYPSNRVIVVGHSLGGAIADVAAAEIRNAGTDADLYTYGAPRIAPSTLSDYITNQNKGGNFRVTHYDDPVPRLPPRAFGYVHISPEYYIDTVTGVVPTADDITVLTGNVNLSGNTGNDHNETDVAAHGWYFNRVAACSASGFEFKRDALE